MGFSQLETLNCQAAPGLGLAPGAEAQAAALVSTSTNSATGQPVADWLEFGELPCFKQTAPILELIFH